MPHVFRVCAEFTTLWDSFSLPQEPGVSKQTSDHLARNKLKILDRKLYNLSLIGTVPVRLPPPPLRTQPTVHYAQGLFSMYIEKDDSSAILPFDIDRIKYICTNNIQYRTYHFIRPYIISYACRIKWIFRVLSFINRKQK